MTDRYAAIVTETLRVLRQQQLPDGGFASLSSKLYSTFAHTKTYHTIFTPALILSCLNTINHPDRDTVRKPLARFLLRERSDHWTFNYWSRDSAERRILPYPDDLDDTFCALSALYNFNAKLVGATALGQIVALLTTTEAKPGGPYHTWVVEKSASQKWRDVDIAVNNNVAYFLSLVDVTLPSLTQLTDHAIGARQFDSLYYPSPYPIFYFMSRWYTASQQRTLVEHILSLQKDGHWNNPLHTALAISALARLNGNIPHSAIDYLLATREDGAWQPYAFCCDPIIDKHPYYSGSVGLTSAFCLEALVLSQQTDVQSHKSPFGLSHKPEHTLITAIQRLVTNRLLAADPSNKAAVRATIARIIGRPSDQQVVLLPLWTKLALGEAGKPIPQQLVFDLGCATVHGWIAYTIYDDFLDEEGQPDLLPLANVALRELTDLFYTSLPSVSGFKQYAQSVLDQTEQANRWEVLHTRITVSEKPTKLRSIDIPDYGDLSQLANRSMGHSLGAIALLFYLGAKATSPSVTALRQFFHHYLIARQLCDDMHDWEEDLRRGHINAAGAYLFSEYLTKHAVSAISLRKSELASLRQLFWDILAPRLCTLALSHLEQAEQALKAIADFKHPGHFAALLSALRQQVQQTEQEREQSVQFINGYKG